MINYLTQYLAIFENFYISKFRFLFDLKFFVINLIAINYFDLTSMQKMVISLMNQSRLTTYHGHLLPVLGGTLALSFQRQKFTFLYVDFIKNSVQIQRILVVSLVSFSIQNFLCKFLILLSNYIERILNVLLLELVSTRFGVSQPLTHHG